MNYGGICLILVFSIPIVGIICEAIKECYRIKYKDDKNNKNHCKE